MNILEFLYYTGCSIRKKIKLSSQKKLPVKVISIGNITTGGTGKTPATIALAEKAKEKGLKPCILTRGYRGNAKGICFISTGESPLMDVKMAGDEAFLMAQYLKDIPIVKGINRYGAGMFALNNLPHEKKPDLFILDDGFQHWGLHRDKDIVLIDSINPFGNYKLLPSGRLREPISEIKRADIIVITKTDSEEDIIDSNLNNTLKMIKKYNLHAPVFYSKHKSLYFKNINGDIYPLEWASGKNFSGFCAIGNPESLKRTLLSIGVKLDYFKTFRDHRSFTETDIRYIINKAKENNSKWIVTTEKDIMKLKTFNLPENLLSLVIKFHIDDKFYTEALGR